MAKNIAAIKTVMITEVRYNFLLFLCFFIEIKNPPAISKAIPVYLIAVKNSCKKIVAKIRVNKGTNSYNRKK